MSAVLRIDLNSDMGESFGSWQTGDDAALLAVVSSANIACGYHAGDPLTIEAAVRAAVQHGVAVGAHPAYPDLEGFGRRSMRVSAAEAEAMVLYQIGALRQIAAANGAQLRHVKPHGALYNDAAKDRVLADAIASAVRRAGGLRLYGLANSALTAAARAAGVPAVAEAFCDRAYAPDGYLMSRTVQGSLIVDPIAAANQALDIATRGFVRAVDGSEVPLLAHTLCVHGDTPGAVHIARAVRAALEGAGVRVAAPEGA